MTPDRYCSKCGKELSTNGTCPARWLHPEVEPLMAEYKGGFRPNVMRSPRCSATVLVPVYAPDYRMPPVELRCQLEADHSGPHTAGKLCWKE